LRDKSEPFEADRGTKDKKIEGQKRRDKREAARDEKEF
jgi:hypothetical protein